MLAESGLSRLPVASSFQFHGIRSVWDQLLELSAVAFRAGNFIVCVAIKILSPYVPSVPARTYYCPTIATFLLLYPFA